MPEIDEEKFARCCKKIEEDIEAKAPCVNDSYDRSIVNNKFVKLLEIVHIPLSQFMTARVYFEIGWKRAIEWMQNKDQDHDPLLIGKRVWRTCDVCGFAKMTSHSWHGWFFHKGQSGFCDGNLVPGTNLIKDKK